MFRAVGDGRIDALWIIYIKPAVSMPEADAVRDAIAAPSKVAGQFGRDFDISGLAGMSEEEYPTFTPTRRPLAPTRQDGRFFADGKARLVPVAWRPPVAKPEPRYSFRLNTGRVRDYLATLPDVADQNLLSGRVPADVPDAGPILCCCFSVGVNTILSGSRRAV